MTTGGESVEVEVFLIVPGRATERVSLAVAPGYVGRLGRWRRTANEREWTVTVWLAGWVGDRPTTRTMVRERQR